jgi:hypothetical protein
MLVMQTYRPVPLALKLQHYKILGDNIKWDDKYHPLEQIV